MNVTNPKTWPHKLRNFAVEALTREHLHGSRENRLISAGLAVRIGTRCVLKLPVRDALREYMKRSVAASQGQEGGK